MDYIELESLLYSQIKNIKPVKKVYESDNWVTPRVIGFVDIGNNYKYEIAYGKNFPDGYLIGVTLFYKKYPAKNRLCYSDCFLLSEINNINTFIVEMTKEIKTLE